MKTLFILMILSVSVLSFGQIPAKFDYPDTLWVTQNSIDSLYGKSPQKPIRVGGDRLPKHIYRYLNSLVDSSGNKVSYKRVGSCCQEIIERKEPLTSFLIKGNSNEFQIYFDQYEWDNPKLLNHFSWNESRAGYYGEFYNDSIFHGKGIYFFPDGGYYKGNWHYGIMSGFGEMNIPETEKYIGEFKEGKYHGIGTLYYPDGGKYEGNWVNGLKQGVGKIYYPSKSQIKYIEGSFNKDSPIGKFQVFYTDGSTGFQEFE